MKASMSLRFVLLVTLAVVAGGILPAPAASATIVAGAGRWVIEEGDESAVGALAFQFRQGAAVLCGELSDGCERGSLFFRSDDGRLVFNAVRNCLVIEGDHAWLGLSVFVGTPTDLQRGMFKGAALVVDSQDLGQPDLFAVDILLEGEFDCFDQAMRTSLLGHARAPAAGATIIRQM